MERNMTVTGHVELGIDDVMRRLFDQPLADDLLRAAVAEALGTAESSFALQLSSPERIADRSARLRATWQSVDQSGRARESGADVHLFAVQSGKFPVTELVVTMAVDGEHARPIADTLHRFLDSVTARLVAVAAG